ncbi:hypothetical protein ACLM5J_00920 [Nocardioides sp. Bht2]|uniref:hypothetical protein n=1 Tax=Nocardioides sp. Bht2 TaxID=3392297 RepID=UPI0039B63E6A
MGARKKFVGIVAASALLLSGAMGTAQAAPKPVTDKNLPTMAQVAKAVPTLKKGSFFGEKLRVIDVPGKTCEATKRAKADAGRVGVYLPHPKSELGFNGMTMVQTVRFTKKAKAKQVVSDFQRFVKRCSGKSMDGTKMTSIKVPKLGDQRVGFFMRTVEEGEEMIANVIVTRRGGTVIQVFQFGAEKSDKSQTVGVTRAALQRSR